MHARSRPDNRYLSVAEFTSLSEVAAGQALGVDALPAVHLSKLLGMKYVFGVMGGFEVRLSGKKRVAAGS